MLARSLVAAACSRPVLLTTAASLRMYANDAKSTDASKLAFPYGRMDADAVRHFRDVERRLKNAVDDIPAKMRERSVSAIWPDRLKEQGELNDKFAPNPFALEPEQEYPHFDVDDKEDFAKAVSYISSDHSQPISDFEEAEDNAMEFPINEVLRVGRHTQVTAGGRVFSFSALVLLGTGKGTAGLGYGRGPSVVEAVADAKSRAQHNMMSLKFHRGNSIGRDIKLRYKKSFVWFKCCRPGHGTKTSFQMRQVLDAFGIKDVSTGRGGSKNKNTIYRAIFKALRTGVRTQEDVAKNLGRKLFNRSKAYYYRHE